MPLGGGEITPERVINIRALALSPSNIVTKSQQDSVDNSVKSNITTCIGRKRGNKDYKMSGKTVSMLSTLSVTRNTA